MRWKMKLMLSSPRKINARCASVSSSLLLFLCYEGNDIDLSILAVLHLIIKVSVHQNL